jgi:hypothetical protein
LQDQPKAQSFKEATNAKERFKAWKDTYRQEFTEVGIFEGNIHPYQIGKSKYTYKKMMQFALRGITSFSIKPLSIAIYLGFTFSILLLLYIPYNFLSAVFS